MVNFIVNENSKSGKGALVWHDVKAYLDENGLEYSAWFTRHKGHAREFAAMLSENEDKCDIIALGGDGTLNEIINGIKDFSKVRVGLIPSGSGNDFARGLGITDKPVELLKKLIVSTEDDLIDIGQLNYCNENGYQSRYFIVSAGGGIDAYVCKKNDELKVKAILNKFHLGKLSYFVITLMSLVHPAMLAAIVIEILVLGAVLTALAALDAIHTSTTHGTFDDAGKQIDMLCVLGGITAVLVCLG